MPADGSCVKNAGEWAEFYVLLHILAEGRLYAADGDLNKLDDHYFPVISIEMQESRQRKEEIIPIYYTVDSNSRIITVASGGGVRQISMDEFKSEAKVFFQIISTRKGKGAFEIPEISNILEKLNNPITKQSSSKKADIHIVIHDVMTGFENEVGFSIKSKHSNPATLINASGQTLFQYQITITNNQQEIEKIKKALAVTECDDGKQQKIGPKERIAKLTHAGFDIHYKNTKSKHFKENLQLIDSSLNEFLAECLKVFMLNNISGLDEIVKLVSQRNPCGYTASSAERLLDFYQYKMKRLIVDSALGMQPKTPWTGKYDASGGYIIVKGTGEVVCYHLYNWNALQDYLYNNLRFETPTSTGSGSKKSFNYALYYNDGGKHFLDICLQLRFK